MTKEQEIVSLQHKISNLESELDKAEQKITASKSAKEGEEEHKSVNEALNRKIALLESELDNAEKQLRETTDKCVQPIPLLVLSSPSWRNLNSLERRLMEDIEITDFVKSTSRRNTLNDKSPESSPNEITLRRSTRTP